MLSNMRPFLASFSSARAGCLARSKPVRLAVGGFTGFPFGFCRVLGVLFAIAAPLPSAAAPPALVARFDGAADYPPEQYFGHPDVAVVDSPLGKYRQAGAAVSSRFGYRFRTEVGRPHLLVVEYPDDRRRNMAILDGTCYDIDGGIMTGLAHPLSGRMLQWRQVYWPRWEESSVTFATVGRDEPAAVGKVEVYALDGLDPAPVPELARRAGRRQFGVQFEDPCGAGASLGAMRWSDWLDRLVQYMLCSGQDSLVYPIVWYHHPLYPSEREPCGAFSTVVAPDRNQYSVWTEQPPDWVGALLEAFGRHGLKFQASLTLLRLGSLLEGMQIDREAVARGAETWNNVLSSGAVQGSTGDWTPIYNVRNLQARAEGRLAGMAYGETHTSGVAGPMFNALHPRVERAVLDLVDEIAGKYGRYPAFRGISVNLWHATFLWFARPEFGYDDFTVDRFQEETGTEVPVEAGAADRFSRRFAWLQANAWEPWLDWRAKKVQQLFGKMRDALRARRDDLTLTVTLWTETTVPQLLGYATGPEHQVFARMSTAELYRRGGFDISLYRDMPGLEVHYSPCFARDREKASSGGLATAAEMLSTFRDHDFLDRPLLDAMQATARPGAFTFDCWIEHWGDHRWFPVEPGDSQAERMIRFFGPRAQGIFRINSHYPDDGFWWKSQLRIAPGFPTGLHYMEHAAFALAEYDALRITRGGLFLDTGHADEVRDFALAFRTLPDRKFETVGASTDPVAVRTLVADGRRYLYIVNRDYYPARVGWRPSCGGRVVLADTVTGAETVVEGAGEIVIGPYQLRTFATPTGANAGASGGGGAEKSSAEKSKAEKSGAETTGAEKPGDRESGGDIPGVEVTGVAIPEEIEMDLVRRAEEFLAQVAGLREKGTVPAGGERMAEGVRESVEKKWYARLRRQLCSYAATKAAQLAGAGR